jgi:hypothetical protein
MSLSVDVFDSWLQNIDYWVFGCCTVKNGKRFSRPQPGCHLSNSPWPVIIKFFPARESLVGDIPARDGKIVNLFLQCDAGQSTVSSRQTTPDNKHLSPTDIPDGDNQDQQQTTNSQQQENTERPEA